MLALLGSSTACDSGVKQIGGLEGGMTETGDGGGSGDGDPLACAEPEDVDIDFVLMPEATQDQHLDCAANASPSGDGYVVALTHCTNEFGDVQPDHTLTLSGDWPAPAFADGEVPGTEVRTIRRTLDDSSYTARWVILRSKPDQQVRLVAFRGTELFIEPGELSPMSLGLDNAGCAPDVDSCAGLSEGLQYRIGFLVRFFAAEAVVADDTRIAGFGVDQGVGIGYEVLVGFASKHECEPDGDFHELNLGIVGSDV